MAILQFNPGYPAYTFVKGEGVLVWVNIEIPGAVIIETRFKYQPVDDRLRLLN